MKFKLMLLCRQIFVMAPPNVVWPDAYCFYPVRPCVRLEMLTRYLAEYLTHFHQTYINDIC